MAAEATHGLIASAAGTAAIGDTTIATVVLPARGQAWKLHNLNAQVVRQTATAAESVGGNFGMNSRSGDITPDPAPSRFPVFEQGAFLGATADVTTCPIHKYMMDLDAAGKASIELRYNQGVAVTAAPLVNIGIHFGPNIPVPKPFKFCDRVRTTVTANTNTQVGTITLSEKATRITGIMGVLKQDGVLVTQEELTGIFSLDSDDIDLSPSFWLFNEVYGAGMGATLHGGDATMPQPHIVDIPIIGGARIDCFVDLITAVTNGADVEIFIMYE